jgi:hypothetical protein
MNQHDDPRDSKIKRLEQELWLTGIQLILTRPAPIAKLLRFGKAKDRSEYHEWERNVIDKAMDIACAEIQSPGPDAQIGERRIKCPLCGTSPASNSMGFLLGGLRAHLDKRNPANGSPDCFVLATAVKNLIYENKDSWPVKDRPGPY